jgi:hypothetical protein
MHTYHPNNGASYDRLQQARGFSQSARILLFSSRVPFALLMELITLVRLIFFPEGIF